MPQLPDEVPPGRPGGLIGAVGNVLRLLRLFGDRDAIRVNQVARDMGLSRSTVHRMLTTLSYYQFVEQDEYSRAYKPGPALVDIGLSAVSKIDIRAASHAALAHLRDLTGETTHLGIMRGATDVLYLDSVESDQVVRTSSRIGWIFPAHSTAGGKALLAARTDEEIAALYPSGVLDARTPRALTSLDELLGQLAEVRRAGYAVNHGETEADVAAVAAAVRDKRGHVRCALVTTAPFARAVDAWVKTTSAATMRVARDLGGRRMGEDGGAQRGYGIRAIIATRTAAMSSLASAPNAVKPRISSLSAAMSILRNPRGSDRVRVRRTAAMGRVSRRYPRPRLLASVSLQPTRVSSGSRNMQNGTRRPVVTRVPPCRWSRTTRKSSKAAWVNCGLPAHSPIAHTWSAVVARCSSTLM